MFKQENFFLWDESNYINHAFYTELNKKLQIYDLISKFRVLSNKYKDHIVLQLEDTRKPGKIETKEAKVRNFSVLSRKPKRKVVSK